MQRATLHSARLVLDAPRDDDVDRITEFCQDPLFEQYLTTPWPYTREDAEFFVHQFVPDRWASDDEFTWAIRSAPDSGLTGVIGWRARGDVGFWMGAPHRGRGYMTEALGVVADWVFATQDVDRIEWECFPGNESSARVARAAGFRYDGLRSVLVPTRDESHPDSWHGTLMRDDDRSVKPGWPL